MGPRNLESFPNPENKEWAVLSRYLEGLCKSVTVIVSGLLTHERNQEVEFYFLFYANKFACELLELQCWTI